MTKKEINDKLIISLYKEGKSIREIQKITQYNRKTISKYLKINGLKIRNNKKNNRIKFEYNKNKFINENEFRYVLIDKNNSTKKFYDVNNKSGIVSSYLKETYNIEIPTSYKAKIYFKLHGEYWFEKYFDIIKEEIIKKKHKKNKGNEKEKNNIDLSHLEQKNNLIYAYEINELKTCYIGRTNNLSRRHRQHLNGILRHGKIELDNLNKFCSKNKIDIPTPIVLEENLNAVESQIREEYWLNQYKNNGWICLNKASVGENKSSLGSIKLKWTYEKCKEEAKKYNSKEEFKKSNQSAYNSSRKHGWINNFFESIKKENGYWNNFENCNKIAKECKNRKELFLKNPSCYNACRKNGWLDKLEFNK